MSLDRDPAARPDVAAPQLEPNRVLREPRRRAARYACVPRL